VSQSGIEDFSELIVSSAEATPSSIQAVETHLVHPAKPEEDEPIVVEPTFAISTTYITHCLLNNLFKP